MKKILCFGDSNTYGYTPDTHQRYSEDIRWPCLLRDNLKPLGFEIIEDGLCGRTTIFNDPVSPLRNGSDALPYSLKENYPLAYAVIMLGTNDCKARFSADSDTIAKGLEIIINQIQLFDSRTKILVVSPIELKKGVWEENLDPEFTKQSFYVCKELKEKYRSIAVKNDCLFLAASDFAEADDADCTHLGIEGHQKLAKAISEILISDIKK